MRLKTKEVLDFLLIMYQSTFLAWDIWTTPKVESLKDWSFGYEVLIFEALLNTSSSENLENRIDTISQQIQEVIKYRSVQTKQIRNNFPRISLYLISKNKSRLLIALTRLQEQEDTDLYNPDTVTFLESWTKQQTY